MAIKGLGKNLKTSLASASEAVKGKVKDIGASELKASVLSSAEAVKGKVAEKGGKAAEHVKGFLQKDGSQKKQAPADLSVLPVRNALQIIYFTIAADGEVLHDEAEMFNAIGKELDPEFEQFRDRLISECRAILDLSADAQGLAEVLRSGIDHAIASPCKPDSIFISSKLLLWDLLAVAYGDGNFHSAEKRLIDYVAERLGIDQVLFLEMQSSILTFSDLEKELAWIKTMNRPYPVIEAHVIEIETRKAVILDSVNALISL